MLWPLEYRLGDNSCRWDTGLHLPVCNEFGLFQQCPEVSFGSDVFVSDVFFKLPLFFLRGWEKIRLKGKPTTSKTTSLVTLQIVSPVIKFKTEKDKARICAFCKTYCNV